MQQEEKDLSCSWCLKWNVEHLCGPALNREAFLCVLGVGSSFVQLQF